MNVLGVDLSLTATGICHPDGSTEVLRTTLRGLPRLVWIRDEVWERCTRSPRSMSEVDLVVLEGYSLGTTRQASHAHSAGELGGAVRLHLWEKGMRFAILPPASLKKYATGRGNATKPDMRMERQKRTGTDERDDNANDAWWLRQAGMCWLLDDQPKVVVTPDYAPEDYLRMPAANRGALMSMEEVTTYVREAAS